jgi:hypothetical protein
VKTTATQPSPHALPTASNSTHAFTTDHVLYSKLRPNLNKVVCPDEPGICTTEYELQAGDFIKSAPPYRRIRQCEVQRLANNLIDVGWPGFRRAKEIYVIDPYFNPAVAKFGEVLGTFLTRLERNKSQLKRLEVHTRLPQEYCANTQKGNWQHWANSHLPSNWKLKIVHWQPLNTGGRMHARYILTDFGGLDYNWGTDADPQEYTQVSLLDDAFWEHLYQRFWLL